jgi:hypothetical protein
MGHVPTRIIVRREKFAIPTPPLVVPPSGGRAGASTAVKDLLLLPALPTGDAGRKVWFRWRESGLRASA